MQYLAWRVAVGLHENISISFLPKVIRSLAEDEDLAL